MFPTDRFPMGTPGCSPVRLCKVHVVPVWERVWRKTGLFTLLRKFRFTADESVPVEVWVSESSVGWSQLQGLNSRSSRALRLAVSIAPAVSALTGRLCSFVSLICLEHGWHFGTYTPAMVITSASSLFRVIYLDFAARNFCGWGMDLDSRELFLFQMQKRFLRVFFF